MNIIDFKVLVCFVRISFFSLPSNWKWDVTQSDFNTCKIHNSIKKSITRTRYLVDHNNFKLHIFNMLIMRTFFTFIFAEFIEFSWFFFLNRPYLSLNFTKKNTHTRKGERSLNDVYVIYRKRSVQWDCLLSANIQQTFRVIELLKGNLVHLHDFFLFWN